MADERDDDELVARYARGDGAAAELLVRRWADRLHRHLGRLAGPDAAPDLLQETFMTFFRGAGTYRPEGRLGAYLFTIATSRARDHARAASLHPLPGVDPEAHRAPGGDPERAALRAEARGAVGRALAALAPAQREVVVLAEYEGMDYRTIAATVGCTLGAVKQRLFRARTELRELLREVLR